MKTEVFKDINLEKVLKDIAKTSLTFGFYDNIRYPDTENEDGEKVVVVAIQNEFGNSAKKIPPRPFMRPAYDNNINKWEKIFSKDIFNVFEGKLKIHDVYKKIGVVAVGDIKTSIKNVWSPPLSGETVARREKIRANVSGGTEKPLIFSGVLINSVQYKIND